MPSAAARTRLIHHELGLGSWTRAARTPDPRLRPLLYRDLLGFEQRDALFGAGGRRLAEQLRDAADWERRFDLVEGFLVRRAAAGPRPNPAVQWAWTRLWQSDGRARVEALAAEIGCSRRYLHSRFREEVGLPPKTVARLVRFQAVRRRIERAPTRWAEVAFDAGYCDQSHLNRDFRELAGTTPTDFLARLIPGGGVVGDQLPFVQDAQRAAA